jgi:hypothetical protein
MGLRGEKPATNSLSYASVRNSASKFVVRVHRYIHTEGLLRLYLRFMRTQHEILVQAEQSNVSKIIPGLQFTTLRVCLESEVAREASDRLMRARQRHVVISLYYFPYTVRVYIW